MADLIKFLFELIFGFLKGHDTNKHKRIAAIIIIGPLLALSVLEVVGVVERFQWFKAHPDSGYQNSRMPPPTMDAGASARETK